MSLALYSTPSSQATPRPQRLFKTRRNGRAWTMAVREELDLFPPRRAARRRVVKITPSLEQACKFFNVPVPYCGNIILGEMLANHDRLKATPGHSHSHDLSDSELAAVIKRTGVDRAWDAITKIIA